MVDALDRGIPSKVALAERKCRKVRDILLKNLIWIVGVQISLLLDEN